MCPYRGLASLGRSDAAGAIFELGGPRVWSFRELLSYILAETHRRRRMVTIPVGLARLQAAVLEMLPGQMLTRDQLLLLARDNVASPELPGLVELGIVPTPVELVVPRYLRRFRPGGGKRDILPDEVEKSGSDLFSRDQTAEAAQT